MQSNERSLLIIITDAHISNENRNVVDFFFMLEKLAANDDDIVFLGDIFDLWIGFNNCGIRFKRYPFIWN